MEITHFIKQHTNRFICMEIRRLTALLFILLFAGCSAMDVKGNTESTSLPQPRYTITGSGGKTTGPLKITRIELNFSNGRGEITVPMNSRMRPYAIIRFDGNGLFRAVWEVDGRKLEDVAINITFGDTLTLRTRPDTILPTFEPGPHRLTLNVTEPAAGFDIPVITYFVTGEALEKR